MTAPKRHETPPDLIGSHAAPWPPIFRAEAGERWTMLKVELERETDGRWIAEVPALPGVLAYGASVPEARGKVEALALRVLADRIEHGEPIPAEASHLFAAA